MQGKRSHGEGYIKQLKGGLWRGQLMDGYTDIGKKNIISFSASTKAEVLRQIREYQSQKEANVHIDRKMTFTEWSTKWYENYKGQVQDSTYCNYIYTLKILNSYLGDRKITDIIPMHINKVFNELAKKYSISQISKCKAMLIQIFDSADANGFISRNPARHSKIQRDKNGYLLATSNNGNKDAFTEEEISRLIGGLSDDIIGHSICLLIGSGIRVQELIALTRNDIIEDGSEITINKAVKTVNGKSILGTTKSKRGIRVVPIPEDFRVHAIYLREYGKTPFIWSKSLTNPLYSVGAFRRRYYNAIKAILGVRKLSPHCCRHTYITMLQSRGVSMETIARLAGHSNITTTDGYLHTWMDTLEKAVGTLNRDKQTQEKINIL